MPPKHTQNAASCEIRAATAANHALARDLLHGQIADLCKELDAISPPGSDCPSSIDIYQDMNDAFKKLTPEYEETLAYISQTTPKRVDLIFSKWDRLRAIFAQHKGTIKHRWEKRTVEKRKLVLVQAWGQEGSKIPPHRRPNFDAYKRGLRGNEYKWTYLVPMINLEDLSDRVNLILFIQSRAVSEPSAFAWSDTSTVRMACENGVTVLDTAGHSMMLTQEPRDLYGTIISWGGDVRSMILNWNDMYEGRTFHLGEGFLCLEIQGRILEFLVGICEVLLSDIDLSNPSVVSMPVLLDTESSDYLQTSTNLDSLTEAHDKAPYRAPQQFDIPYLRQLVMAKREEAIDDIWTLREDPSFFHERMAEFYKFHRDCDIATWSVIRPRHRRTASDDRMCLRFACREVIGRHYGTAITWNMILQDLTLLENLKRNHGSDTSVRTLLPEDYKEALHLLCLSLQEFMGGTLGDLSLRTACNPNLKQYYRFEVGNSDRGYGFQGLVADPLFPKNMQLPPMVVLLNDLQNDQTRQIFGSSQLIDEIEHMMFQDGTFKSQRQLVDIPMATLLSDLSVLGEIDHLTNQHQPKICLPKNTDAPAKIWEERQDTMKTMLKILVKEEGLVGMCQPLSSFAYPADKKPTEQTVNQLRSAEAKLDTVWHYVDQHFVQHIGMPLNDMMGDLLGDRQIQRTAPWQPPIVQPKPARVPEPDNTLVSQFSALGFATAPVKDAILSNAPKTKLKTRGKTDSSKISEPVDISEGVSTDKSTAQNQQFILPKKAYNIMAAHFPTDQDRLPGKIRWGDFMGAMCKVGFSICPLFGSVFLFKPSWEGSSPISLHGPHPEVEIPPHKVRRHGSRLARKYGWTSETFISK